METRLPTFSLTLKHACAARSKKCSSELRRSVISLFFYQYKIQHAKGSNKRGGKSTIGAQEEPECTETEMKSVVILDARRMCEPLGIFKPLIIIIIEVQLSLTVVRLE